jgi:carboxypeptidase family protein
VALRIRFYTFALLSLAAVSALAQTAKPARPSPNGGTVTGTVKDTTGAIIPGATVTLTADDGSTQQVQTGQDGVYTFRGVAPGTYSVSVASKGLEQADGVAVLASTGQTARGDVTMRLAEVKQEVTVAEENTTQLSVQTSQNVDALVFKGADLAALPDDPDDLQQDLQALAGPSAGPNGGEIFIDGFSSGRLPPKESIREIRINQNPFASEYDKLGFGRIEIFTKPGSDNFHGTASYDISDGVWNARNPFIAFTPFPPFSSQTYGGNISGPLSKRASFFLDVERRQIDDNGILNATLFDPTTLTKVPDTGFTPTPQQRTTFSPRIDLALTGNNTLSMRYSYLDLHRDLWGVGLFNLPGNGYSYVQLQQLGQVTDTAVLSTSVVNETRFQFNHYLTSQTAQSDAPEVIVAGDFDTGGAGINRTVQTESNYEFQNYTTVTHGKHTIKFGARTRNDLLNYNTPGNFNGTFLFASFADYSNVVTAVGTCANGCPLGTLPSGVGPTQFSLTEGQPLVSSTMFDVGAFVGDDWRVAQGLTVSAGLRWEGQTNIHDWHDAAPRLSFAWAPGRSSSKGSPATVIRGGFGMFYIRYPNIDNLYTQEFNGRNQLTYEVNSPNFYCPNALAGCVPSALTSLAPVQFSAADNLRAPYLIQSALGVERQVNRRTTLAVNVTDTRGVHQFVTSDVSPPGPADLFQFQSDGLLKQLQVITRVNTQLGSRASISGAYIWGTAHSNTDGSLCASSTGCGTSTPVNPYDLSAEWSRSSLDVQNRTFIFGNVSAPLKIQLSPFLVAQTGAPFNITTGGYYFYGGVPDGIFNARPVFASGPGPNIIDTPYGYLNSCPQGCPNAAMIPRNLGNGPGQVSLNLRLSRTWGFGTTKFAGSSGGARASAGGGPGPGGGGGPRGGGFGGFGGGGRGGPFGGGTTEHRYNLTLSVSARNILNHVNYAPPVGSMGSSNFLESTAIAGGFMAEQNPTDNRRIDIQLRFQF